MTKGLKEGEDYTIDPHTGLMVLTAAYLAKRGYCCKTGCRHCPYGFRKEISDSTKSKPNSD